MEEKTAKLTEVAGKWVETYKIAEEKFKQYWLDFNKQNNSNFLFEQYWETSKKIKNFTEFNQNSSPEATNFFNSPLYKFFINFRSYLQDQDFQCLSDMSVIFYVELTTLVLKNKFDDVLSRLNNIHKKIKNENAIVDYNDKVNTLLILDAILEKSKLNQKIKSQVIEIITNIEEIINPLFMNVIEALKQKDFRKAETLFLEFSIQQESLITFDVYYVWLIENAKKIFENNPEKLNDFKNKYIEIKPPMEPTNYIPFPSLD